MKKFRENILFMVIGILISITFSYALAANLVDSKDVYYKDNSGLLADNVQDAIDGTCMKFENKVDNFLDKIYPVGSIYISTTMSTADQVKEALGGEWQAYGDGRTLVGVGNNGISTYTVGTTGGSETISYTPGGTIGSTGLTISQIPSHSHSYDRPAANTDLHYLTIAEMPSHSHDVLIYAGGYTSTTAIQGMDKGSGMKVLGGGTDYGIRNTGGGGGHSHPISTTFTYTGAAGNGTTSDGHTHSFTGTAASISTLQPYITVYMYKRTK